MKLPDLQVQGRHEHSGRIYPELVIHEVNRGPKSGDVILRIEDEDHPSFWIDISLSKDTLYKLHQYSVCDERENANES